jgi:arginase
MPVSFLLGIGSKVETFSWVQPILKTERLVYIGLRDVDSGEKKILREHNIKAFSMYDVDKYGIGKVVDMALDHVNPGRDRPIHLSFDVDALDPSVAPSTGIPVSETQIVRIYFLLTIALLGSRRTYIPRRSLHL